MKILILTFYFPPDLSAGSFRADALVRALLEVGDPKLQIDVITTMPNRYRSQAEAAPASEEFGAVTVRRVPLSPHRSGMADQTWAFTRFAQAVRRLTRSGGWDLVFATSSRLMTAALGAHVAQRTGAPLYLDIRDLFTDTMADLLSGNRSRVLLPVLRRIEARTFRRADRLNVVSAGFLDHVGAIGLRGRARCFTNGIDDEFLSFDFGKAAGSQRAALPLIVYAGNMGEGQGLHQVLPNAARLIRGRARLRLIGDGGMRAALQRALQTSGTPDGQVQLLSPVPRIDLMAHYRDADILFLHLNSHGAFHKVLPSKIFEYAATGKPILAGVAGHAADFLRREVPGAAVFTPCDAEAMLHAFDRVQQLPPEIDRSAFCEEFSRASIMRRMAVDVLGTVQAAG